MQLLELAASLISFNTEAPPGNEDPCARFISDFLSDLHIPSSRVERKNFAENRSNVVATFEGDSPGLLLAGHIDVVPSGDPADWSHSPHQAEIRKGRLYGRGASDMKGGLAAILAAIASIRGKRLKRTLSFVGTAGEEVGFDGLHSLVNDDSMRATRARCGVVGEPTEMRVVRAHRGGLTCRLVFQGRSAHAGNPSLGVNAIENCVSFLRGLDALRKSLGKTRDPVLGRTIITPTMVAGGSKSNVIPDFCELTLDSRVTPAIGDEKILRDLRSLIADLGRRDSRFGVRLDVMYQTPVLNVPPESEVVRLTESLTGSRSGTAAYSTEAPIYCALGTPTVVLGPGSIKQAHKVDEYASVEQIRKAKSVYSRLIERICL